MRQLTTWEIENLANSKKVRRIAVENFLATMGTDMRTAIKNLELDARLYQWNAATRQVILKGIKLARK